MRNKIISLVIGLLVPSVNASLSAMTAKIIEGRKPTFTEVIETKINDFDLFGLQFTDTLHGSSLTKNYYGDNAVKNLPLSPAYPFKSLFNVAPVKQPTSEEYSDIDGDALKELAVKTNLTMQWYYTDANGQDVAFTPSATDTFCGLTSLGKTGPYKIKLTSDVILSSIYGAPDKNEYPNEKVPTQPSKTYVVLNDAGICYAKPELDPSEAVGASATQWSTTNGFLTQSITDGTLNFPQTAFYGAKFDLILSKNGLASNYDWTVSKGSELVNILPNSNTVTVLFDTVSAQNTLAAWSYVVGAGKHEVVIEGKHRTLGHTIYYPFTIKTWFSGWSKANLINATQAYRGNAADIIAGCDSLDGKYRISHANEVSNAPFSATSGGAKFTREIGTLLGEWGDANQTSYPGSWAARTAQANSYKRIWLYDTSLNDYCDLHTYNAKYHCISEAGNKNGICTAVP